MNFEKYIPVLLIVLLLCTTGFGQEIEGSGMLKSTKTSIVIEGEGEISGNLQGRKVEIEILSFKENRTQKVLSLNEILEINGKTINGTEKQDDFGNRYVLFEVKEKGSFTYKIEAIVETDMTLPDLQEFDLNQGIDEFPEFAEPTTNIQSNEEAIRTLALNRFGKDSWIETLVDATQWTYESLEYDISYFPETYPATEVLEGRKGVCDEFAVLSASILRARGIPTRVVTGITYNPKEGQKWNNHAWLESWNPNSGWIASDPTFGEAGTVGGTHIARGFFTDPKNATITKIMAMKTVSVKIEEKLPKVEILSTKQFENVFSLEAEDLVMPTNKWTNVGIQAENLLDRTVIGLFSLVLPADFRPQGKKKIEIFLPREQRDISWERRNDKELTENQYLTGKFKVYAIGTEIEKNIKVLPGESFLEEAKIRLVDLLPLVEGDRLIIEATVENLGTEKGTVNITANTFSNEIEIRGFEKKVTRLEITGFEDTVYAVSISGPGLNYETEITVHEGQPLPPKPVQEEQVLTAEELYRGLTGNFFSIETGLIAGLLIGIAVIVLLLKELLSR